MTVYPYVRHEDM